MSDSPTTTNGPATIANEILHALIFDVAVQAAEAAIIAAAPALGMPVLKQIDEAVLDIIADQFYQVLSKGVTFSIIDAQTSAEAAAANVAANNLKAALAGDNQDAIDTATDNFKTAFGNLVHYDGSASP